MSRLHYQCGEAAEKLRRMVAALLQEVETTRSKVQSIRAYTYIYIYIYMYICINLHAYSISANSPAQKPANLNRSVRPSALSNVGAKKREG